MFIDDNDKVVNMTMPKNEYENGFDQNRLLAVLGYMTITGWLISLVLYGKHKSSLLRFHLRQSLGLFISATFFMVVPVIGWLIVGLLFIAWCYCVYSAVLGHKFTLPVVGDFYQLHFDFI